MHAAGVVISDRDLSAYIPLTRGNDGGIVSQYAMGPLTDLGMLKMDFLGLKTLTVIDDAVKLIHHKVPGFDVNTITLEDQRTFDLLNRGETVAVFQLESGGMTGWARQFDIRDIEDLNALIALYRPGPMDLIPDYVKRKKGLAKVKPPHKLLNDVTKETYGVLIYQEQVMQAAQVMAGYTLGGADLLRRAMGKKDREKMAKERIKFREGAEKLHGIEADVADDVFDTLEKFAGYGFNRSHSAAYAWVSYQTAYLKANYPLEFMAAVMSNEVSNTDKITNFVGECERMGIPILEPDVNRSCLKFQPEETEGRAPVRPTSDVGDGDTQEHVPPPEGIRFGLAAIKNVSEVAMEAAIEERGRNGAFVSLEDFCGRVDTKKANKKTIESLVKCGAFDWTMVERAQLFSEIDAAMAAASSAHRDRASGQSSLFDVFEAAPARPVKTGVFAVPPWTKAEKLAFEKELLGFYVTGHPLDEYRPALEGGKYVPIAQLGEQEDRSTAVLAGALTTVEKKFSKKGGKPFAIVTLEDFTGSLEVMVWGETFEKAVPHLEVGKVVTISGRVEQRDEGPRLSANDVKPMRKPAPSERPVVLTIDRFHATEGDLLTIRDIISQSPGKRRVELRFRGEAGQQMRLIPSDDFRIAMSTATEEKLAPWLV